MIRRTVLVIIAAFVCLSVFGQTDLRNIEFHGRVTDGQSGIEGVAVTDGYNIVTTDSKGRYSLLSNAKAEFVYISLPSGYEVPVGSDRLPCLYKLVDQAGKDRSRYDFELKRSSVDQNRHTLIVWADPQVYFDENIPLIREAAREVAQLAATEYSGLPVHGIVCGDMIGNIKTDKRFFGQINEALTGTGLPFFFAVGNHDMDVDVRSNELTKTTFRSYYGPTYYSFNRGGVHYVVLDDVFSYARHYLGYIDECQFSWLEQDLSLVPNGQTVVVAMHIPSSSRAARRQEWSKEEMNKVLANRSYLYNLLKAYDAHIIAGHEHYNENYVLGENMFEHVHAALSGLFWQSYWNMDGTPGGYGVYEFENGRISRWYYKALGKDADFQFNAYPVGSNRQKPDAVTVNVWNWDPAWSVEWYENGTLMGQMERYTGWDPTIYNDVEENRENFKFKYVGVGTTEHLFFATPSSADSKIRVEVADRFGQKYIWQN